MSGSIHPSTNSRQRFTHHVPMYFAPTRLKPGFTLVKAHARPRGDEGIDVCSLFADMLVSALICYAPQAGLLFVEDLPEAVRTARD